MSEEFIRLISIGIGRVFLGGTGYGIRWSYYKLINKKKKLSIDDYENKIVAIIIIVVLFAFLRWG